MRDLLICAILLLIFGFPIGCRKVEDLPPESTVRLSDLSDDDQVREAIFRSAGLSRIGQARTGHSYYLAVDDDQDPSDKLMNYLNNGGSFLKRISRSYISPKEAGIVRDKLTDEKGARFSISKLKWQSSNKVSASAGMYKGNTEAEDCVYTLALEDGEWKIVSKEGCVVS